MSSGAVAKQAEQAKRSKYAHLDASHHFVPVVVETSGVLGPEAHHFLQDLRTPPQGGNWGTKVLPASSPARGRGRTEGEFCSSFGIYEGIHRLGLGGVVTGIYILLMNLTFVVISIK